MLTAKAAGAYAQTGDGGGVQIMNITVHNAFNSYHNPEYIIPKTDTGLKASYYILSDDEKQKVVQPYQPKDPHQYRISRTVPDPHLYLPYYIEDNGRKRMIFNQRLVLSYKGDTMLVDFIGLPGFNANGFTDVLETLEFYPHSHIRLYRDLYAKHPELKSYAQAFRRDTLYQVMRKGLSDTTYSYLRDQGMMEDMTNYKKVVLLRQGMADTTLMNNYPVYTLQQEQIALSKKNDAGTGQLRLQLSGPPLITDTGFQYRLLLNQFVPGIERYRSGKKLSPEEQRTLDIIGAFSKDDLYINENAFSGTILLYYNSEWDNISARGGTFDLIISRYLNGHLVRTITIGDVGYLNNDHPVVRPTGN